MEPLKRVEAAIALRVRMNTPPKTVVQAVRLIMKTICSAMGTKVNIIRHGNHGNISSNVRRRNEKAMVETAIRMARLMQRYEMNIGSAPNTL